MKNIEFQDIDRNTIRLSHSSLASQEAYRIYLEGEQFKEKMVNGDKIPFCLHLNRPQVSILISALQDLLNDSDESHRRTALWTP